MLQWQCSQLTHRIIMTLNLYALWPSSLSTSKHLKAPMRDHCDRLEPSLEVVAFIRHAVCRLIINKKLSYRWDIALRRQLRRSCHSQVHWYWYQSKPVCDFIWVTRRNTYIICRTIFQLSRSICQIIAYDEGVPLIIPIVLGKVKKVNLYSAL